MSTPLVPIQILSHAEIYRRYHPTEWEYCELLKRLKGKGKHLATGGYGYFLSDVERVMAEIRLGRQGTTSAGG